MTKIIYLILCCSFAITLAETPTWFRRDIGEITRKCNEKYLMPADHTMDFNSHSEEVIAKRNAIILCRLKESNVYNDKTGLDVDRLKFVFKSTTKTNCEKPVVQECVDKNKDVKPEGEKMFRIVMCMAASDIEMMGEGC